jgi:DHA1 family tetracycline resistance protein-like MFS transporter
MNRPARHSDDHKNPMLPVFMTVFIDLIGFSILIPVFPLLIANPEFRVTPADWSDRQGLIMLGFLQAVYPLCTFIAAPILGQLSDKFGRRPVLAISILGTALGYAVFAIGIGAASIPLLFIGRAIDGFTGGNIAVAQAAIGDISNNENRQKNFGLLGAAFGLGFIIGPYIGGRLSAPDASFYGLFTTPGWFGATTPFWFATGLCLINFVLILARFPETIPALKKDHRIELLTAVRNVTRGFASPRLRVPLAASFFFNAGFTFFTTFFGVYLARKYGFSQDDTGDYFAVVGLAIAVSQVAVVPRMAKVLRDHQILKWSYFGLAVAMAGYFLAGSSWQMWAIIPVFTFFNGLNMANQTSLISRSAEMGRQGEAMGISSSVMNLAQVPASILVGYITGSISSNTPLVVSTACIAAAGLVFLLFFRPTYVNDAPGAGAPGAGAPGSGDGHVAQAH